MSNISLVFPCERPVFIRETNNGMYRVSSYFWGKVLSELPMAIILPLIQSAVLFYGVGFDNSEWQKYPIFFLTFLLSYNAFGGLAYLLGASIAQKQVINILLPIIVVPTMLFAGFFVN